MLHLTHLSSDRILSMINIQDIRLENLKRLADINGGQEVLAERVGVSPPYISLLMTRKRPVTEKTARKWEQVLGLESGWLDTPKDGPSHSPDALAEILEAVTEAVKDYRYDFDGKQIVDCAMDLYKIFQDTGEMLSARQYVRLYALRRI